MHIRTALPLTLLLGASGYAFAQPATMTCADQNGRDTSCELNSQLNASIRIGLAFADTETSDNDFSVSNFGSRIRWGGETELDNGLSGLAYIELGANPDDNAPDVSGVNQTRQLWAGLSGDFGTAKIGAQYAAFYDLISSHTDIAYWGSCWTQEECGRETRVLKYEGEAGGLKYAASFVGAPDDDGNDVADELEFGANFTTGGGLTFGLAASIQADDATDVEQLDAAGDPVVGPDGAPVTVAADDDGGTLLGAVAKGEFGGASLALGLQLADEDFVDGDDDLTNLTFAGSFGNAYVVANVGDSGDTSPYFATLGYAMDLTPAATVYYEVQTVDADDGTDSEILGRAVFIYNFDAAILSPMEG